MKYFIMIGAFIAIIGILFLLAKFFGQKFNFTPRFIAKTGIFSAISIILYTVPFLKFGLPIFPAFLELHFDEVPALIAGFAYGPICGSLVILIKTIVKLPLTGTAGVGELADLIYSVAFIIPAALIYQKHRSLKGALSALGIATLVQLVVATTFTTYVMLDAYCSLYGLTREIILGMCQKANPAVKDLNFGFLFIVSLPFNLIKDIAVILITMLLYKRMHTLIDRI